MAEGRATKYAVVTGANKGIGFEICRQLASHGVFVILGARNEKRGLEALEKLKDFGLAENVVFHQLDVVDNSSVASLSQFIKTKFGRLDILVNNAGIGGVSVDADALGANTQEASGTGGSQINWNDILTQSVELAKECLETNFYGMKRMTEAFIPLLQLSKSPRIVNVSSSMGKLKVNNAGVGGLMVEGDLVVLKDLIEGDFVTISNENEEEDGASVEKSTAGIVTNYELTKQCLETNFYGAKRMIEAFIPLLQLSNSPRIVNVASFLGKLKLLRNEWAKKVLSDVESLTEERVEEVVNEFLKDFAENSIEAKGWPSYFAAYKVSKAALIAYTRVLGSKYPNFRINSVCPGYCGTDMTSYTGSLTAEEGAESLVKVALLPNDGPSGLFFYRKEVTSF